MFSTHTPKSIYKFLCLFLICILLYQPNIKAQCIAISISDSLALVEFYMTTNGDNWQNNDNWLSSPVSEWNGITLTNDGCFVKNIILTYQQLEGNLPNLNLPNLEELTLFNNSFSGEIPNFSNMPNLKRLYLGNITSSTSNNAFTGQIPDFDNLQNLEEMHIGQNRLTGSIPNFSNLPKLQKLILGNTAVFQYPALQMESNEFVGGIPDFNNLPNLVKLDLSGSQLTGSIPDFSNLPNLQSLNLGENQLTGGIPNFSNLESLFYLQLVQNNLGGNIPNFDNLPQLEELSIAENQLTGEIPNFGNLPILKYMRLNDNNLNGNIPNFSNTPILESLNLEINHLSGNIPDFSNIPELTSLLVGRNNLVGTIPNFSNLLYLTYFSCTENLVSGNIPDFDNLPELSCLMLSNNDLLGEIPNFSLLQKLTNLSLYGNQLSGNIPDFDNLPNLIDLFLHKNQLSGSIPDFDNLPNLLNLYLYDNNLTGFIPDFSTLFELGTLYVHDNELIGAIPNFSLPKLEFLRLCPNALQSNIPSFNNCPLLAANDVDVSCVEAAQTTGYIYVDTNGNCIKDEDESIIPNTIIATTDSSSYAFSDENGFYSLKTNTGTHTFYATIPNYLWQNTCPEYPNIYTVEIANNTDSLGGYDFGFQPLIACPLLLIEVSTPLLRRCFTNTYTIHYCNTGTLPAENASIKLALDATIIPLDSSLPYSLETENELVFDIGTVAIGQCGSFTLTDSLSCNAILGSTACIEATAFPNDLCFTTNELWDGSDLKINASCLGNEVAFEIVNTGDDMEQESEYRMYEDDILTIVEPLFLNAGESLPINTDAIGSTIRLTAYQNQNHPSSNFVTKAIELCGTNTLENASLGFITTQSNLNYTQFYDMECQEIIGSFDPNDKTVMPKGVSIENRITESQVLEYKIRFQNTGNDTAFRVVVIDTIDTDFLDINSLKLGVSSHDYTAQVINNNILIFSFENILLLDSNANETASHGFVSFKISQQAGNQRDDLIQNKAAIYFDYNQPIITNKAFNMVGLPDSTTAVPIMTQIKKGIPASVYYEHHHLYIQLLLAASNVQYSFNLYDMLGRQIQHEKQLFVPHHDLFVGNLTKGIYVFEIVGSDGKKANGKFIVP